MYENPWTPMETHGNPWKSMEFSNTLPKIVHMSCQKSCGMPLLSRNLKQAFFVYKNIRKGMSSLPGSRNHSTETEREEDETGVLLQNGSAGVLQNGRRNNRSLPETTCCCISVFPVWLHWYGCKKISAKLAELPQGNRLLGIVRIKLVRLRLGRNAKEIWKIRRLRPKNKYEHGTRKKPVCTSTNVEDTFCERAFFPAACSWLRSNLFIFRNKEWTSQIIFRQARKIRKVACLD